MNYYRFPDNRITKALLPAYIFVMYYLCRDSMFAMYVVGFYPSQAITLGLTAVLGLGFLLYNRAHFKAIFTDSRMILVALSTVTVLLPMVCKQDWQPMYLTILAMMYIPLFLSYFTTWREVAKIYVVMLCCFAVYSIFAAYIFRIPIDLKLVEKEVFRDGRDVGIYNFWFAIVPRSFVKNRNFGIFREPGVYQYFLLMGLFLSHYGIQWKKERSKWIATAIFCLTMVTTFATGGVAEMCLLALFVFIDKKMYRSKALVAIALVIIILVVCLLFFSYGEQNALWWELYLMAVQKFSPKEDSFTERVEAIWVDLDLIRQYPLFGTKLSYVLHAVDNNTSSSLILMAGFGILWGLFHVLGWFALVWDRERSTFGNLFLLLILFMAFNTQNLTWNLFFWLFPMMALAERAVPVLDRRRKRGGL